MPEDSEMPRDAALERLKDLSVEFETEIVAGRNDKNLRLSHHAFGELKPLKGFELATVHIEHHTRQLPQNQK